MATKTTARSQAQAPTNVVTPFTVNNVAQNQVTDHSLAVDLHRTRKLQADQETMRLQADTAEIVRDITQVNLDIKTLQLSISEIKRAVTTVKRDTDAVIAQHKTTVMQSNVRLAADKANNKEAQVTRAINRSSAQGVTLKGTDYSVQIKLPSFKATVD